MVVASKAKNIAKKIYSDSDSEDEIKPPPKLTALPKSKLRLYSDTLSEDDEDDMDADDDDDEADDDDKDEIVVDKIKTPEPAIEFDEVIQPPRTPGRESPSEESKKQKSYDYDRVYSDSEEEREYQEKRRRNTEYMEQIEREFKEEQMKQQQSRITGETTEEDVPERAPSPSDPTVLNQLATVPTTPDVKLEPPMDEPLAKISPSIVKKNKAALKKPPNGLSISETSEDDMQRGKASPVSCTSQESQTSQLSQVQLEHCYSLPPTASPAAASSTNRKLIQLDDFNAVANHLNVSVGNVGKTETTTAHDHGYTSLTTKVAAAKPGTKGPGRPRKIQNQLKASKSKAVLSSTESDSFAPTKSRAIVPFIPQNKYNCRGLREDAMLLYEFLTNGIDKEDIEYIRRSYEFLLRDDQSSYWLNATHFRDHCETDRNYIPPPNKKRKKDDELRKHSTGSARTEGYYKVDVRDKARFKYHHNKDIATTAISEEAKSLVPKMQGASREARSNQRRLLTAFGASTESELLKFNQLKFRKKQLKFAKSSIHDWGLFAMEPIAADEMVIEYVGQMIRPVVADLRETQYEAIGIGSSYLFRIDLETIIDATKCGNLARFINHSCNVSWIFWYFSHFFFFFGGGGG